MPGPWNQEEIFWDNFNDSFWNDGSLFPEIYGRLTETQHMLVNAASLAHQGGSQRSYPCEEDDVAEVACTPSPKPPLRKVSIRRAAADICHYNSTPRRLSSSEQQTMRHLQRKLFDRVSLHPTDLPGLVIRAFKDLDAMLFGSYLLGRVHVRWGGPNAMIEAYPENDSANTHLRGLCTSKLWGSRIDLCIEGLLVTRDADDLYSTLSSVLVTLLHEMVHAYFYVRCAEDDVPEGHDNSFWCALEAVAIHVEQDFRFRALHKHFDESYQGDVGGLS